MRSFPLVSATGILGSGFRADSLDKAVELGARMIGCDAGSTDPGPGPLATGTCIVFSQLTGYLAMRDGFAPDWPLNRMVTRKDRRLVPRQSRRRLA
jgi:hypothetical protein